jgi:AcrR family transcriptional regulator
MQPPADPILDAAAGLVGEGTPLSMSAVAARAGVARGTLYRRFADLAVLTQALVASGRAAPGQLKGSNPTDRILDALAGLLAQRGLSAMTIEDVAARAGVAPATIYRRFGDRRGLLQAFAAARTPRRLSAELENAAATGDLEADLTHIATECLRFLADHRAIFMLAFSADAEAAALFAEMRQGSRSIGEIVTRYLQAAIPGAGAPEAQAFLGMLLAFGLNVGPSDRPAGDRGVDGSGSAAPSRKASGAASRTFSGTASPTAPSPASGTADADAIEQRARRAVAIFLRGVLG